MRVYAEARNGKRRLAFLECDACDVIIRPGPDIGTSGWVVKCTDYDVVSVNVLHYCPKCKVDAGFVE